MLVQLTRVPIYILGALGLPAASVCAGREASGGTSRNRGEIGADVDLGFLQNLYVGPILYRLLVLGSPLDSAFQDRLVEAVLAAVRPDTGS